MGRTRSGSGALLGISAIGVVVMSIMVFTQGYLSGVLSQTDAVLAGRKAEYLADGAIAEGLLALQEGRNTTYVGLFQGGASFDVDAPLTSSLVEADMSLDASMSSASGSADFHGDGRGFHGTVSVAATVGVPRRVARTLGISAYRTVRNDFEYKGVLQGPPDEYADKMLFVREMKNLPEVKEWYEGDLWQAWDEKRVQTEAAVREDAQHIVDRFALFVDFASKAADLLRRMMDWPGSISGIGNAGVTEITYDPPNVRVDASFDLGPVSIPLGFANPQIDKVRVRLDDEGAVEPMGRVCPPQVCAFGVCTPQPCADFHFPYKDPEPLVPDVRSVVTDVLEEAVEEAIETVIPEGLTAQQALDQLEQIASTDVTEFLGVFDTGYPLPPLQANADWPPFRTDDAVLSDPAYVLGAKGSVRHDELLLEPPPIPGAYPDSPLNDPLLNPYRSFDPVLWRDVLIGNPPGSVGSPLEALRPPFEAFPGEWRTWHDPYLQAWETELRELEGVISFGDDPPENLMTPAYWSAMAAYQFPDIATGMAYIQSRWGRAGAVYRFAAGGDLSLAGLAGDGTFVTVANDGEFTVGGAGSGAVNVVAGHVTVGGSARAALFSSEEPVDFGGATVNGLVAAKGLKNIGRDELDPFTINHDAFSNNLTFSVCEYPVTVVVDRGE